MEIVPEEFAPGILDSIIRDTVFTLAVEAQQSLELQRRAEKRGSIKVNGSKDDKSSLNGSANKPKLISGIHQISYIKCKGCGREVAASRYAAHLEKCLISRSRNTSSATSSVSSRINGISNGINGISSIPNSPAQSYISSDDSDDHDDPSRRKKKRKVIRKTMLSQSIGMERSHSDL